MTSVQREWISKYFRITKRDRNCYKGIQEITKSKYYDPERGLLVPDNVVFTQFIQSYNNVRSVNPTRHRILELSWDNESIKIHKICGFCRDDVIQCDNSDFVKLVREKGIGQEEDGQGRMFVWTFIEECDFDPDNQVVMPDYMFTDSIDTFDKSDLFVDNFDYSELQSEIERVLDDLELGESMIDDSSIRYYPEEEEEESCDSQESEKFPKYPITLELMDTAFNEKISVDEFRDILSTVDKGSYLCKNNQLGYDSYNCIFIDSSGKYVHVFYDRDNLSCAGLHVTIYLTISDNIQDILSNTQHICNNNTVLRSNYMKNYFVPYFEN